MTCECSHSRDLHRWVDPSGSVVPYEVATAYKVPLQSFCTAEETVQPYSPLGGSADDRVEACRCLGYSEDDRINAVAGEVAIAINQWNSKRIEDQSPRERDREFYEMLDREAAADREAYGSE